jgi:hypothetical protein
MHYKRTRRLKVNANEVSDQRPIFQRNVKGTILDKRLAVAEA